MSAEKSSPLAGVVPSRACTSSHGSGIVIASSCDASRSTRSATRSACADDSVDQLERELEDGPALVLVPPLGYRHTLAEPAEFAPTGTTISWCAFLKRAIVDRLPSGIPPIPLNGTNDPAGGSRRFQIRPGFTVSTGYMSDPLERLAALRDQGVISEAEHQMPKDHPSVADTPRGE
jgi:hypothetical protein